MSNYHLHHPDLENPTNKGGQAENPAMGPPPFPFDSSNRASDLQPEMPKDQAVIMFLWMSLSTACCVPVSLYALAGIIVSPMMLDSGTKKAELMFQIGLLVLTGGTGLLIWSIVIMWQKFVQEKNYKLAFLFGLPSVLVQLAITILYKQGKLAPL